MEPLAVAVYSCERGDVTSGSRLLICGAGMCDYYKYLPFHVYRRDGPSVRILFNTHVFQLLSKHE